MSNKPTVFNYQNYEKLVEENKVLRCLAEAYAKTPTVSDTLEYVKSAICDDYCKWPELLKGEPEDRLLDMCNNCPLERL